MRILCCLDGTNSEHVRHAINMLSLVGAHVIALLTVADAGPPGGLDRSRQPLRQLPGRWPPFGEARLAAAREAAAKIVEAGLGLLPGSEILVRQGRPELEIMNTAAAWRADFIMLSPRTVQGETAAMPPNSIGHVARFVLDSAACSVLLVGALSCEYFERGQALTG